MVIFARIHTAGTTGLAVIRSRPSFVWSWRELFSIFKCDYSIFITPLGFIHFFAADLTFYHY
jgi:hypothetical protein